MNNRRHILVMAYMLSPYKGSEFSVAWNYVIEMSKDNDLTVLYGISGDHMGECDEMEAYLRSYPVKGVNFVAVKPNKAANALNFLNRHDILVYTFYYAYQVWQKQAYDVAKKLCETTNFDLVHYVGMIGYREPGYLWKLNLPYVWGPISGANNAPMQLMGKMPFLGKAKQVFRNFANNIQFSHSSRLKKALNATDILLTATSENHDKFLEIHGKESICMPENAILGDISLNTDKFRNVDKYHIIFVGSLDARKAVGILMEAVSRMRNKSRIEIDIVGDGPLRNFLKSQATLYKIDNQIHWHGKLPRREAVAIFERAHIHSITSVSEGNPTTIWEAMMHGVPTISFDHCGMHDTLKNGAGILVPLRSTYEENIKAFADALDKLTESPEMFRTLALSTIDCAKSYTWEERRHFFNNMYERLLSDKMTHNDQKK